MSKGSTEIIIPLIKTRFSSFSEKGSEAFALWNNTVLTELNVEKSLPRNAIELLDAFFTNDLSFNKTRTITAIIISIPDHDGETIDSELDKWKYNMKFFRVIYWMLCGNPINPFFGFLVSKSELLRLLETPRGIDPNGDKLKEFQSVGITHEYLDQYIEIVNRMEKAGNIKEELAPFFDLTDAGFDNISLNVRLLLFIASIESILVPGVRQEITHQLAERSAIFATEDLEERIILYDMFKKIYNMRSAYIHGESDNISTFKLNTEEYKTSYILRVKFLFPIMRKLFASEDLLEYRQTKTNSKGYYKWNEYFAHQIFK